MKFNHRFLLLLCSMLLMISFCAYGAKEDPDAAGTSQLTLIEGDLSSISATTLTGKTFTQEDLAAYDMTVINLWATTCGFCIEEMEGLEKLYEQLPERVNFVSICIDAAYDMELAQSILSRKGATFDTLIGNKSLNDAIIRNIAGTPTTIFVDSQGKLIGSAMVGAPCVEDMDRSASLYLKQVESHLKELN